MTTATTAAGNKTPLSASSATTIQPNSRRVMRVVFLTLLLDILAFTIILPLLPRLIDYYRAQEGQSKDTLLARFRTWTSEASTLSSNTASAPVTDKRGPSGSPLDTVLLGGALGSLFSFLQFIISPVIGRLSDRFGRRVVLLYTLIGNLLSCLLWAFANDFTVFLLARIVGGLSEGNVQLAVAIITDVTHRTTRSRGLAMVGIAFAIGFTVGPAMGAYFASWDIQQTFPTLAHWHLNPYSGAALFASLLIIIETIIILVWLDETSQYRKTTTTTTSPATLATASSASSMQLRYKNLNILNRIHFLHLFLFSGMEYTLTFLTHDVHGFTPMENGKLLSLVGIVSAAVQGGYVRRSAYRIGEKRIVLQGIIACAIALLAVAQSAHTGKQSWLWISAIFLAVTSATVVNCLTSLASMQCDDEAELTNNNNNSNNNNRKEISHSSSTTTRLASQLTRGMALGHFRSLGQLGRAAGPMLACTIYWLAGPVFCYTSGAIGVLVIAAIVYAVGPDRPLNIRKHN
ncbi:major facilitator superfamily domain-containing protein [Syncephalis plumigaleata]|nr:major facilitator superfamily domain-containing protein [Syncephalis plumigaleata]